MTFPFVRCNCDESLTMYVLLVSLQALDDAGVGLQAALPQLVEIVHHIVVRLRTQMIVRHVTPPRTQLAHKSTNQNTSRISHDVTACSLFARSYTKRKPFNSVIESNSNSYAFEHFLTPLYKGVMILKPDPPPHPPHKLDFCNSAMMLIDGTFFYLERYWIFNRYLRSEWHQSGAVNWYTVLYCCLLLPFFFNIVYLSSSIFLMSCPIIFQFIQSCQTGFAVRITYIVYSNCTFGHTLNTVYCFLFTLFFYRTLSHCNVAQEFPSG